MVSIFGQLYWFNGTKICLGMYIYIYTLLKFYWFFACVAAIFKGIICSILHYKNNRFILCQFRRRNLHEQKNIRTLKTYLICRWNTKVYLNIPFVQILDNGRKRPLSSVSVYTAVRKRIFLIEKSTNGKKSRSHETMVL